MSRIGRRESHPPPYALISPYNEGVSTPSAPPLSFEEEYSDKSGKFKIITKWITIKIIIFILLGIFILELGCTVTFHKRDDWLFRCLAIFGKGYDYSDSSFWIIFYFVLKGCCITAAVIGMILSLSKVQKYLRNSTPQKYLMMPMLMYLAFWILLQLSIIFYITIIVNRNTISDTDEQRLLVSLGLTDSESVEKIGGTNIIPFGLLTLMDILILILFSIQLYRMWRCPSF